MKGDYITYKLSPSLRLVKDPVIIVIRAREQSCPNSESLWNLKFDKKYLAHEIMTRDNAVVVNLKAYEQIVCVRLER